MEKTEFSDDDVVQYNLEVLPQQQKLEPCYKVIIRPTRTKIRGGDDIDLGLFLSGVGIPDASKCFIHWESAELVNQEDAGYHTYCIQLATKHINDRDMIFPVSGAKFTEQMACRPKGVLLGLTTAFFLIRPPVRGVHTKEGALHATMAEFTWDDCPPILVHLNSSRKAKAGDYTIDAVLTYVHREVVRQSSDRVVIHVTSRWERNQWWVVIAGSLIAFALLILGVVCS